MIDNRQFISDLLAQIEQYKCPHAFEGRYVASFDLETWGKRPGCAVRSIGASLVDMVTGRPVDVPVFYVNVTDRSCLGAGLTVDYDTQRWWARQGDAAIAAFHSPAPVHLANALASLSVWLKDARAAVGENLFVMGNGKEFDVSILEHCYGAVHRPVPWEFWETLDLRTIVWMGQMLGIDVKANLKFEGTPHRADDDAVHQGRYGSETTALILRVWEYALNALSASGEKEQPHG